MRRNAWRRWQWFRQLRASLGDGTKVEIGWRTGLDDVSKEALNDSAGAAEAAGQALPTILVVDDEPGIVEPLAKIFEKESLRVLTAKSGGEALELLRRQPVSVLLTDLVMPGMSGLDLLKASRSVSPETETILMTAYGTVENAVDAMRHGAYDFVTKPVKRDHVVRAVGKAIEKRNLVQENR